MRDYWYENDFFILTQTKLIFTKKPLHLVSLVSVQSEVMFTLYRIAFRVELEQLVHNAHQTSCRRRRRSCWPRGFGELRACLHGGGGPQVGEVTRLGGVTRLSI